MELQLKGSTNPSDRFHVPSGLGKALIAAGVVEEYRPPLPAWLPMRWAASVAEWDGEPFIGYSCPNCSAKQGRITSKVGTAHQNAISHCAGKEFAPRDVVEKYKRLWDVYAKNRMVSQARKKYYEK